MARPSISRAIKRNRLREMEADCTAAGQEFIPASALFDEPRKPAREKSRVAPKRSKAKSKARRAA